MYQKLDKYLGACMAAFCLAGVGNVQADWMLHTEYAVFNLDNYDDDGGMFILGGGYQVWDNTSVKADYGMTVREAETTRTDGTRELDLTQIRFYMENHLPFGDTGVGAHFRYGLVRLDADVSVSGSGQTPSESGTTNFHFGAGLNWQPARGHRLSVNVDLPDSNITTFGAGYQFRF